MPDIAARLTQLKSILIDRYFSFLPEPIMPGASPEQIEQNKLSKSLAAVTIAKLADVDASTAAGAVIDGFDDNGIDAVYYDSAQHKLFLVQSKYKLRGGEPDQAEVEKFARGIHDLRAKRYENFNSQFHGKLTEIEDALDDHHLKIVAVLAHTANTLSEHPQRVLNDLEREVNEFALLLTCENFTLDRIYELLVEEHALAPVSIQLTLENWYKISEPYTAYYGQVTVGQLAQLFALHGKALFERNIRYYMGSSGVNNAIARTLRDQPEKMFYLNNGLTAICASARPKPTAIPQRGEFVVDGISIVNGAQTVGAIANVAGTIDLSASPARVLITLIELADEIGYFGEQVTFARNYQNQVRVVDFAALDPYHEKLRRELAISGITYHYKPSKEAQQTGDTTFTLQEVALALSCFSGKTEYAVTAKKEIGRIWDRQGTIYPQIFKDTVSAVWICRAVRIYRFLTSILDSNELAAYNRYSERMFYRHARYFVLHILARKSTVLRRPELNLTADDKQTLSRELNEIAVLVFNEAEKMRADTGYLALSRNMGWAIPWAERVMKALSERESAANKPIDQDSSNTIHSE